MVGSLFEELVNLQRMGFIRHHIRKFNPKLYLQIDAIRRISTRPATIISTRESQKEEKVIHIRKCWK